MAEILVINTGPLVALARAELLDVVGKLPIEIICPVEVSQEIAAGVTLGYPNAQPEWLTPVPLAKSLNPVATASLDTGEAAVIQLALERGIHRVCIDERKGRRAALAVGLKITGTIGLLARARALNIIPKLRPLLEKLSHSGVHYNPQLIELVLQEFGESAE